MLSDFMQAAKVGDLKDGQMRGYQLGGEHILLVRLGDEYFAINNICSHMFTYLEVGDLHPEECAVQCPLHESAFDLRTGEPTELPADEPVEVYSVRIDGDAILIGPKTPVTTA